MAPPNLTFLDPSKTVQLFTLQCTATWRQGGLITEEHQVICFALIGPIDD